MSTEALQPSKEKNKKKGGKEKHNVNPEHSLKKRKRQADGEQSEIQQTAEPVTKRSKKDKKMEKWRELGETERRPDEKAEEVAAEPIKKLKKKRKESETAQMEAVETNGDAIISRKPKKTISSAQSTPGNNLKDAQDEARTPLFSDALLHSHSPFVQQTTSFYVGLSPCAQDFPLEGVCAEHISPLLLTYYPPLKGVVFSYANPRISEHPEETRQVSRSKDARTVLARSIDEYAVTYVWLTADFLVFRPKRGVYMEGFVNLQNESILGLICYNYFNVGIERSHLPRSWQWIEHDVLDGEGDAVKEAEGYFVDGNGTKVGGRLVFRVKDFEPGPGSDTGIGSINIHGTLLSWEDERA